MNTILSTSLLILCAVSVCYSYGTGAPIGACTNLAPSHSGVTPQTSATYSIVTNSTTWSKSGALSVELTGGAIHGFILQAKQKTDSAGIGMFDEASLPAGAQMGPCMLSSQKISVTHMNPNFKASTKFAWKAPTSGDYSGAIYFQGAVAVNKQTIWTNIKSSDIAMAATSSGSATTPASEPAPDATATTIPMTPTATVAIKRMTESQDLGDKMTAKATLVPQGGQVTSGSVRMWMSFTSLTLCSVVYMTLQPCALSSI